VPAPILLLIAPDEMHPFDAYLEEILLTEGYNWYDQRVGDEALSAEELAAYPLVLISSGAAQRVCREAVEQYLHAGGRVIVVQPPRDWGPLFGLEPMGETYATARDAYLQVNAAHAWLEGFPAVDLQCPGENHVYRWCATPLEVACHPPLAFTAGQLGLPTQFPAVASKRVGEGLGVIFTYDLADCVVRFHQGRIENASTGPDPDADRDGKFTPGDLLEGMRDFRLRHVPQADVHQDLLVRVILGLMQDVMPLPRLWHFPDAAPGLLFVNGDGDGMNWEDMLWTAETCERFSAHYTCYLMDAEIEAFTPENVVAMRARGHAFGPHPWCGLRPTIEEWRGEIARIVGKFQAKSGFAPQSLRSHSCIFPGWDESPAIFAANGLRLDTNFVSGYRWQSGYSNGSGLPARFIGRDGRLLDCYEQCTIHGDDVLGSPKCLMPVHTEDESLQLSLEVMRQAAEVYHTVYHPYFHPIYLGGRGGIATREWFTGVLQAARDLGLPSLNADEWLAFNDARRAVTIEGLSWNAERGELTFTMAPGLAASNLTVLLPPRDGRAPVSATVDGEPASLTQVSHENLGWTGLQLDLGAGERRAAAVTYEKGRIG